MVGGRCQGTDSIVSGGKTTSNNSLKKTFSVSSIVDPLKEGELGGIESRGRV